MLFDTDILNDDKKYARRLVENIVRQCPRRRPTSQDERRAQEMMESEFQRLGLETDWHAFEFNDNLYKNIALHFGMSSLGTAVSGWLPALGFLLHGLAAGSYWAESTRRAYILRRLLSFKPSQNLLATLPAKGEPQLRIVLLSHADAAFTGFLFGKTMIDLNANSNIPFLRRSMALATFSVFALMGFDLLRIFFGPLTWPLRPVEFALTIPSLAAFGLNLEVVMRDEIVPGAADNLSGVAALPILARRLAGRLPEDVELVFGVTGCEEASLGGGDALARDMATDWDPKKTVVIGLDTLSNGDLHYLEIEGEVVRTPIPGWLKKTIDDVALSDPRFRNQVKGFEVPVGGSDVAAFLARGWEGACLSCVDPTLGAPRHYHHPSDTPENMDWDQLMEGIDFAEKLVLAIATRRPD